MTAGTDFDTFVKKQQAEAEAEAVDWAKEREIWLKNLEALYAKIEGFLATYIEAGTIKREYDSIALNEENIGSYSARRMLLRIGRQEIILTPAGTMFIGTKGRVDVVGPAGRTRLMLVPSEATRPQFRVTTKGEAPKEINWAWKIVTRPPTVQYIELTQDSVFQALMEVAGG